MFGGAAAGVSFGFFFSYRCSPNVVLHGFPIPHAFFVLEPVIDGKHGWVDYITPLPWMFAATNVLVFACLGTSSVWFANTSTRLRHAKK
jgi:hypothetical protein